MRPLRHYTWTGRNVNAKNTGYCAAIYCCDRRASVEFWYLPGVIDVLNKEMPMCVLHLTNDWAVLRST